MKLPHLEGWAEGRRRNAALYDELLGEVDGVMIPAVAPGNSHVYNQYTLKAHHRDELRDHLSKRGIGTGLYYPLGLHLQECFSGLEGRAGDLRG